MAVKKSILWIDEAYNNGMNNVLTHNSTYLKGKKRKISFRVTFSLFQRNAVFSCTFSPPTSAKYENYNILIELTDEHAGPLTVLLVGVQCREHGGGSVWSRVIVPIASNFQHISSFFILA